jgi:hypothetical protein
MRNNGVVPARFPGQSDSTLDRAIVDGDPAAKRRSDELELGQ